MQLTLDRYLHSLSKIFIAMSFFFSPSSYAYDLTIIGVVSYADGLGRIPIGMIDILMEDLQINFVSVAGIDTHRVSERVKEVILNQDKTAGNVSILTVPLFWSPDDLFYKKVPDSKIKIAYSMFESSRIPPGWSEVLNKKFDAVVVPDSYLVRVYEDSGVKIPIFVLPLGMYLDEFIQSKKKEATFAPFIFGASAAIAPRKNLDLTIRAFAEEFGNSHDVVLNIHGRLGVVEPLQDLARSLGVSNVLFTTGRLSQDDYVEQFRSIDCYVNLSKGEGFSCCPREALALGIPCILSNNTSQKTLCKSGFVRGVVSKTREAALYGVPYYDSQPVGYQFNCTIEDVREAYRDVYTDYTKYLILAKKGRKWVSQYTWENLRLKYLNLVKPKKILLGKKNVITDRYLMTSSRDLYEKYKNLFKICDQDALLL